MNSVAAVEAGEQLRISLEPRWPPAMAGASLLLGFHFGPNRPEADVPGLVSIGIDPIGRKELFECWWYAGDVEYRQAGRARIAECEDYAAIVLQAPDVPPDDFRALARDLYAELLSVLDDTRHRQLVRVWNYFSEINRGQGDEEKYRQFSVGRAEAFDTAGVGDEMVPAATGIGCVRATDFSIVALASRHDFRNVENPRQVSAFRYPRDYGPRSPKFSRAGCVSAHGQQLVLISGTAAIIGHESVHAGNAELQCDETLKNLRQLGETIGELEGLGKDAMLDADSIVRVYLRHPEDLDDAMRSIGEFLGGHCDNVVFLHADICRRELQIEIDATKIAGAGR